MKERSLSPIDDFSVQPIDQRLDVLKGTRPERIEVFLYTKLIGVLLIGILCDYLEKVVLKMFGNIETSHVKIAKFVISMNILVGVFKGYLRNEITEFINDKYWVKQFCKQKRKRKTTIERIEFREFFGTHQVLA